MSANRTALRLVCGGLFVVMSAACTKTGTAWVSEPENSAALGDSCDAPVLGGCEANIDEGALDPPESRRGDAGQQTMGPSGALAATRDAPSGSGRPAVRPRLAQTVTLGEVEASEIEPRAARSATGPSVVVNNYAPPSTTQRWYGGWYGASGVVDQRPSSPRTGSNSGTLRMGQDWPTVPSYGPPFPYRSAPASPWAPVTPPVSGR